MYFYLGTSDALLIKLMDSVDSLLHLQPALSLSLPLLFCSLPLKQSIHSSSKYVLLTSQEKSIMGQRAVKEMWGEGKWGEMKDLRIMAERKGRDGLCSVLLDIMKGKRCGLLQGGNENLFIMSV